MSLELIVGPPNSGRAGAVLRRFEHALTPGAGGRDPLLVVPTRDDVERFERELAERPGAALGGRVATFPGLVGEAATAAGAAGRVSIGDTGRGWLARAAARSLPLRVLGRAARQAGFAPALAALSSDLRAAGLDAAAFDELTAAGEEPRSAYETELVDLISRLEELVAGLGLRDSHDELAAATRGLRAEPARWGGRAVLFYGFDDLTREQVELVAALAAATAVVFVVAFEDRPALAARAELLGVLRDELGGRIVEELRPDPSYGGGETLYALERNLFEQAPATVGWDGSVRILEAAGERGEAELVARRIAELLVAGIEPDEIAVVTRSPDRSGALLGRVLSSFGVPVAVEARAPLAATATGGALLRLLAIAAGEGDAGGVVAYLRARAIPRPQSVDWLERTVRRRRLTSASDALEAWGERPGLRDLGHLHDAAHDPPALASAITAVAADIAERPHLREGPQPSGNEAVELRAAAEVGAALAEVAELGEHAPALAEVAELLAGVRVPLWHGSARGRVRVLSPYRIRAGRVRELFVAGLGDGAFPAAGGADPLLGDGRRRELGIGGRRDPAIEERYLFWSCVSRPEQGLTLSYPVLDDAGRALARSPFVDEVRDLLEPAPTADRESDPLEIRMRERIGPEGLVPAPERASSPAELARALAALGKEEATERAHRLDVPDEVRSTALSAAASARRLATGAAAPGPLRDPHVLAALSAREGMGASTLEQYDLCSYRWFAGRELDPQSIEPDPDPLESGSIVHRALEVLYRDPPGAGPRPTPEDVGEWCRRARAALETAAEERGWRIADGRARIALSRLGAALERYLERDAATGGPMQPRADLLELAFGDGDEGPALDLGGVRLHGRIDRIDVSTDGKALIHDYKHSSSVPARRKLIEEGRLQLPLYMAATRNLGLEPIGALYHPLAASGTSKPDTPRGVLAAEHRGTLLPEGTGIVVRTDYCSDEELDALIDEAADRARAIATAINAGSIDRNPRGGTCPSWCGYAPICRMERSLPEPEEDEEDEA